MVAKKRNKPATTDRKSSKRKKKGGNKTVFRIDMLPADHGDCLIVTYGTGGKLSRMLIDCGTTGTVDRLQARLRTFKTRIEKFDVFVLTHIDADHIGGSIDFFNEGAGGLSFDDVWFNGWKHLPRKRLSAKQGEIFTTLIEDNELPWNEWMDGKAILVKGRDLPTTMLNGGMKITLLSPTLKKLESLSTVWQKELDKHGFGSDKARKRYYRQFLGGTTPTMSNVEKLAKSKFRPDSSKPNGSSIAFLAEYEGRRVLFSGDAHASVLKTSITQLLSETGEECLRLDAFKLPHHGSRANLSADLVKLLDCQHYLVSTSGAQFKHPDGEAMARVVIHGGEQPTLHFNYRTKYNEFWGTAAAQKKFGYRTEFPPKGKEGITLDL